MMERDLHQRASALFLELRDTPQPQRERALRHAAGGDDRLLREVQSLLEHDVTIDHSGVGAIDERVTSEIKSSIVNRQSSILDMPERIGPYRVLRRIGRGGSGYVMLAEQDEPVRRRVAIKIVPHAALDPEFAARFEVERRALERTDHPNIARILDTGRTADGLPYLVMDFVEGVAITEHCRAHGLDLRARIELMLQVADGVQHAHQRGVIHRDLKPGNILVSEEQGQGADGLKPVCRARVLDFGIAKPIPEMWGAGSDSPPTIGLPLGTPAYMAPEQAGGAGSQSIDTRADVYALGAVLYELTCGRPPNDVKAGDPLEALRRIREVVPPSASSVLHRGDRGERGEEHQEDLLRVLRGEPRWLLADLDCILAKALEKEPARRYSTVAAFAEDLRRLLRREPIEARPPTLRYRAARFAQRNRALVASMAIVLLAVLVGIAGLTAGLIEAKRQRREADNQTDAQREINRFLTEDLLAGASPEREGQNVTALDLLHRASHRVEQRFAGRPLIAGAIHHTLGEAYSALGAFDDADRHLQRAIELRRAAAGPDAPDTVRSEILAASLLARRQKLPEAEAALTRVITRARLILGANDPALYTALNDLGTVYSGLDRGKDAVNVLQEALQGRVRLLGPVDPQVLVTMSNLSDAFDRVGDTKRMLDLQMEALRLAEQLPDPPRMTMLELNNNVGATFQDLNQNEKARPYLEKAAELARGFLGEESPDTTSIELNLGALQAETGRVDEGLALIDRVIAIRTRLLGPSAIDTITARMARCSALWHSRRFAESVAAYRQLLPEIVTALSDDHWLAIQTRASLALALLDDRRPSEALPYAEKAVAQFTALYGSDHARTVNASKTLQTIKDLLKTPLATTQPAAEAPRNGDAPD